MHGVPLQTGKGSIGSYPACIGNVDHLLIGADAFDLVIRLRPGRIAPMNFRFVGQRFTAETVNSGDGGVDIVHLETYVVDAEP